MTRQTALLRRGTAVGAAAITVALLAGGCSSSAEPRASADGAAARSGGGTITVVGAENEYANVLAQIGGKYVRTVAVMSDPNTDPHTFEASPAVAQEVGSAQLVVQNGVGYDTFMNTVEKATPSSSRQVIDVQSLLGLPDSTANPHLWYDPATMPEVAGAIAADLARIQPADAGYFQADLSAFDASLAPWNRAIAAFKAAHPGMPVATTEPVADYLLTAIGADNLTPWSFQADIMNGVDPSPQDAALETSLFTQHKVKVFLYNQQVTDSLTARFQNLARQHGIPVVGVYETMPTDGYTYQSWMLAEVNAVSRALATGQSTEKL
ncbi:metal ABC transporter solute-binding protein, Zn/Mn family [Streptacidiphilus sp. P02-A3a]|uniref:metal ABC transporter solute-binding protein, Zn/Mn family n=1 Tax=Streptacidiphilus sp. P02-A3a TaxID=2704468 RepID=UPI0015FD5FA9|nr:zinc ABC transporter substrate-binding protein [Streptacidiphilus sp. P02-A3a]QMU67413.1 zinc ABC transporter solute-binding protein [Streptacidiphilus sp. P02-A3a]